MIYDIPEFLQHNSKTHLCKSVFTSLPIIISISIFYEPNV